MRSWIKRKLELQAISLVGAPAARFETFAEWYRAALHASLDAPLINAGLDQLLLRASRWLRGPGRSARLESLLDARLGGIVDWTRRDDVAREVQELMAPMASQHPALPLVVLFPVRRDESQQPRSLDTLRAQMRALAAMAACDRAREGSSEARANALVHAAHVIAEGPYKHILEILWRADRALKGHKPPYSPPRTLWALMAPLGERFPHVVDDDIRIIRNAIAHNTWRFVPSDGSVRFATGRSNESGQELHLTLDELEQRIVLALDRGAAVPLIAAGVISTLVRRGDFLAEAVSAFSRVGVVDGKEIERHLISRVVAEWRLEDLPVRQP